MLSLLLYLVGVLLIAGLVLWAVDTAPFLKTSPIRPMIHWLVVVVAVIICVAVLLNFLGVRMPPALR
jgi:hypothetical protein